MKLFILLVDAKKDGLGFGFPRNYDQIKEWFEFDHMLMKILPWIVCDSKLFCDVTGLTTISMEILI